MTENNELNQDVIVVNGNQLTIWKLGSLEHHIIPTMDAIEKLEAKILELDLPGKHIVWGPALEVLKMDYK